MQTISWQDFWTWIEGNSDVARVMATYESKQPTRAVTLRPVGGGTLAPSRERATTEEQLRELMRFFYLRATSDERWPMHAGAMLDGLWHTFILDTATYRAVCDQLGTFIEHRSGTFTDDPMWYPRFLTAYTAAFKEAPNWNVWPSPSPLPHQTFDHDCA